MMKKSPCFCLFLLFLLPTLVFGQKDISHDEAQFFEAKIRPALIKYCYECHSIDSGKTRGGLLVDSRDGLLQGGENGPALEEDWEDSIFLSAINWDEWQMPPGEPMPDEVIADFKKWLEMGAPDPRVREKTVVKSTIDVEAGKNHWAFKLPQSTPDTTIDSLIEKKLDAAELRPVDKADPMTLLRRLNFDLIGLPPSPEEITNFVSAYEDDAHAAIEAKVDELLASSHFGERWGRHWLDVARYAESSGNTNFAFPHAWRYRDYVIDSFNDDTPYNQFIQEQIAGDLLPASTDEQRQEQLIATGFLAVGIKKLNDRNPRTFEADLIDEQIDTTSQAFLGITVSCARCHDHKFDPIPTVDYYAMAGIFKSTETLYGTASGQQNRQPADLIALPIEDDKHLMRSYTSSELGDMRDRIDSIRSEMREIRIEARRSGKRPEQRQMLAMRNQIARLEAILQSVDSSGTPKTLGMGVKDLRQPVDAHVLLRGDVEAQAQQVERGFLQVLNEIPVEKIGSKESGRRQLADWLSAEENPLTARVMANRVWMHLLGQPLVLTPNNWGTTAQEPLNPELLDHLAVSFVNNGWSIKSLIKQIVMTEVYQRSSELQRRNYAADPDNHLFWRANARKLDAEALRDSILTASSTMDLDRPYGSEVTRFGDARVGRGVSQQSFSKLNHHRSVYLPILRNDVPEFLSLFDFANPDATNAQRDATNVPSQSLYLMNSEWVTYQSQKMAIHLTEEFPTTGEQVKHAFFAAFGRPATQKELNAALKFFQEFAPTVTSDDTSGQARRPGRRRGNNNLGGDRPRRRGGRGPGAQAQASLPQLELSRQQKILAAFCQSLMASAEFRILN